MLCVTFAKLAFMKEPLLKFLI
ncbi:hypothetical protein RTM1035_02160 [Roseovarius sp. TM1035]|nr:hypothetical protein RTM1035_02160 [Roseovarius sp. TM1035]